MQTLPKLLSGSVHTPTPEPTSQGHTHRHAPLGGLPVLRAHSCSRSQHTAPRGTSRQRSCTEHSGTQSKFGEPRHSTLLRLEML